MSENQNDIVEDQSPEPASNTADPISDPKNLPDSVTENAVETEVELSENADKESLQEEIVTQKLTSEKLQLIVEGALLASNQSLTIERIAALFTDDRPSNPDIRSAIEAVAEQCADRGYELKETGSGFRFQVRQELAPWVSKLYEEKPQRYSRALLETLALIAYRQPITRGDIEAIRGVSVSSSIVQTLLERNWVRVVGHRDVPGRPAMYATTRNFLDYFNLTNLDELPSLSELRDLNKINEELDLKDVVPEGRVLEFNEEEQALADSVDEDELDDAELREAESLIDNFGKQPEPAELPVAEPPEADLFTSLENETQASLESEGDASIAEVVNADSEDALSKNETADEQDPVSYEGFPPEPAPQDAAKQKAQSDHSQSDFNGVDDATNEPNTDEYS